MTKTTKTEQLFNSISHELGHDANVGDIIQGGIYPGKLVILEKHPNDPLSYDGCPITRYRAQYIDKRDHGEKLTIYNFSNYHIV